MSAQSAKKKRLGSRRRGANQNEESNAESHRVDSTFVAQHHIPEENVESYAFSSPDYSQHETKYPPSPEFSGNRRKLGSSRRLKGKHVKEYATEAYHEPREEVEEKTEGMETTTEKKSLAIQPERQEVISQDSATHDGYLCSATAPDNSSEVQSINTTDSAESLFPQSKHLQSDPDKTEFKVSDSSELVEPIQEETDRSDSKEVTESTHLVDISDLSSLSGITCQTVEQQLINQSKVSEMPEEYLFTVYPETEKECKKRDHIEIYEQDGNFQGNGLVSESHVESVMQFSTTPETTTEQIRSSEMTETECSIGQATVSSPKEELHTDEEHNQTEDAVMEFMPAVVQEMSQIEHSSERLVHDATETGILTVKSSSTELVISNDDKQDEHPTQENNFESSQHKNEDQRIYDSNESPTSDIERVDTAQSHAYETEDRVPSTKPTGSNEKEMEESESSSQKASFSSSTEEQDVIFSLSDVKSTDQSDDNVSKVHEQELTTTLMPQFGYLTDSLIQEAIENPDITTGNMIDPTENNDKHKSELIVKTTDDPPTNQEMFSDIESVDTALGQVYETEDQIEEDIKPSAELTGHQQTEGLLLEMMASDSSLQTLQSDINAPFDSGPQENDTVMAPFGNRRKLGSSRRHRGRRHVKDSAGESHHEPTEDVVGNTRDNEPFETEIKLTIETAEEKKSMETVLEEMDKFDTAQTEDVSDDVREKAHVGSDLHPSSTGDQQTVVLSDFGEMAGKNFLNVFTANEEETQERDMNTELFLQDEILQTNHLVSELHVKSEDIQFSIIPEITTNKHSSREHTEPEQSIEQAAFSSSKVEMSSNEEHNECFSLSDVKSADQSEDNVNEVHEQEVTRTEIQEMPQPGCTSESVKHVAIENYEITSGNLIDPNEDSDKQQSDFIVKTTDDSPTNQEMSNLYEKQDDQPTIENNCESSEHKDEDHHVYDTNEPPMNDTESVGTTKSQAYETEHQVSSTEPKDHQEMDDQELESESSSQTLQSEMNVPFNTESQENNSVFKPFGNRRKLGSSRRLRGRHHVKDPAAESSHDPTDIVGNARDNEPFETTEMLLTKDSAEHKKSVETVLEEVEKFDTAQTEDFSDEIGEKAHVGSDLFSSTTEDEKTVSRSDFGEMSGENLLNVFSVTEEENKDLDTGLFLQEDQISQTNYLVSESHVKSEDIKLSLITEKTTGKHSSREPTKPEYSIEQAPFSPSKEEQDLIFSLSDVKSQWSQSEDNVSKVHEQELTTTLMPQFGYLTDSLIQKAIENPDITTGNMIDPTENNDEHKSELIVKTTDDPPTNQEMFSDIESVDTALGQVYETEDQIEDDIKPSAELTGHQQTEGFLLEMMESESSFQTLQSDKNAPFDSGPQENDTVMAPFGNRRKLGSSRRHRGRRHVKDSAGESHQEPTEDVVGNTRDNEPFETEIKLTIKTAEHEKSMETVLEEMDRFDTAQSEDVSVKLEEKQFSVTPETTTEMSSPGDHTGIECSVEQAAFPSSSEDLSTNEEQKEQGNLSQVRTAQHSENAANEEEVKATQMQEMQQINNSSIEDSECPSQALKSEMNAPLDCEPLDNSQSIKDQTRAGFSTTGSRRKLGSSRRNKGQLHVKDTTKISLVTETVRHEELNEQTNLDFRPTGEIGRTRLPVNDRETAEKMLEDDLTVPENEMENSNDDENKLIKDPEDLSHLTVSDTVKNDGIQSTEVSVWKHDSDKIHSDDVEKQEAFQVKNMKAASCDQENKLQQTNDTLQTGDVTIRDYYKREESLKRVQVSEQTEEGDEQEVHDLNVSQEIKQAELFSVAHSKTETLALFNTGPEENMEAEPAVDVSQESEIFSQSGIQEKSHLEDGGDLHGKSKQRRRKMGSTRRSLLSRTPEEKNDETDTVEKLPGIVTTEMLKEEKVNLLLSPENKEQETTETSTVENSRPQEWSTESNLIPAIDYSKTLLHEQTSPHNHEVVNPVVFVHAPDVKDSEGNVDAEPLQTDDVEATEMHFTEKLRSPANPSLSANTGVTQSMQNEDERSESVHVQQGQAEVSVVADLEIVKSLVRGGAGEEHMSGQAGEQEAESTNEEDHNLKMKNSNSPHRRRKLGSTRRNLGSRSKREDVHQNREVDDEATTAANVVAVKTDTLSGIKEDEPQVPTEHKHNGSEERQEKEFKTMSDIKPVANLAVEENPDSLDELKEPEPQHTPSYVPATLSTSPKHDFTSEALSSGRRRKLGSHRKSHGHKNNETAGAVTDESAVKTTDELREDSSGLDKISKVEKSDRKPASSTSSWRAGQQPVSEKTHEPVATVQQPYTKINLGQESHQKISLADDPKGANSYNVMMVGDSSVGKTSFMKRAQSGKFSLNIPASVGLDSCMWNVVVDGRPVVLKLWDTAGQERFHSITKQIFHKAHAFLLMYDITSSQSFSAVSYWASCIQEGAAENVTILLVGNKSDCAERKVKTHEAEILAKENNFEFVECSAATGENVVQCLETVARMLSQKDDTRQEALVLHKEPQQKKSSGCC